MEGAATSCSAPSGLRQVLRELKSLTDTPAEGIRVLINEDNISDVQAEMDGPAGTPFEHGIFRLRLCLAADHPASPPKGIFITKIFHPNVSASGEICVSVLKKDWSPDLGLRHVLQVIRCLLIQPFPDSALNEEAGKLLLEDYEAYAKHARLMTSLHATNHTKRATHAPAPTPLTTSGANAGTSGGQGCVAGGKDGGSPESASSPLSKKARPDQAKPAAAVSKVKKSLKRL